MWKIKARGLLEPNLIAAASIAIIAYSLLLVVSPFERNLFAFNNYITLLTPLAIAAAGTTLVLITGGFDLSVAGTISLSNVMAATLLARFQANILPVILMIVLVGLIIGLFNGLLIVLLRLQSLAVTLATYICTTGIALVVLPAPGGTVPSEFTGALIASYGGVPFALLVLVAIGVLWMIFKRTRSGNALFAIGADRQASIMSGIAVKRSEIMAYTLAGGLYAVAGLYLTGVTSSGDPNAGQPFLLTVFAAMALGMVSFRGGSGNAIASMLGAASLMTIPRLLFGLGVEDYWSGAFQGLIILAALCIPLTARFSKRKRAERRNREPMSPSGSSMPTKNRQGVVS